MWSSKQRILLATVYLIYTGAAFAENHLGVRVESHQDFHRPFAAMRGAVANWGHRDHDGDWDDRSKYSPYWKQWSYFPTSTYSTSYSYPSYSFGYWSPSYGNYGSYYTQPGVYRCYNYGTNNWGFSYPNSSYLYPNYLSSSYLSPNYLSPNYLQSVSPATNYGLSSYFSPNYSLGLNYLNSSYGYSPNFSYSYYRTPWASALSLNGTNIWGNSYSIYGIRY
jgi:hypothetical protein